MDLSFYSLSTGVAHLRKVNTIIRMRDIAYIAQVRPRLANWRADWVAARVVYNANLSQKKTPRSESAAVARVGAAINSQGIVESWRAFLHPHDLIFKVCVSDWQIISFV